MEKTFSVQNDFADTITRYVSREAAKGKDPMKTMGRIMTDWLFQAMANTPKANREKILAFQLKQKPIAATRRRRNKLAQQYAGTNAAMLVRKTDYAGQGRTLKGAAFYRLVRKYVNARRFSSGAHRAGFMMAVKELRSLGLAKPRQGEQLPSYRSHPSGFATPHISPNELILTATNIAKIIAQIAPNAFDIGAEKVSQTFSDFMIQDMLKEQQAAGLNAKRTQ